MINRFIKVEIAYVSPYKKQVLLCLMVKPGTSAIEAIQKSGILVEYQELYLIFNKGKLSLGIFGDTIKYSYILQNGDRIEIYRPLIINPKKLRILRSKK